VGLNGSADTLYPKRSWRDTSVIFPRATPEPAPW
jgi:hypothetical protein